jgi:hypothetical protein
MRVRCLVCSWCIVACLGLVAILPSTTDADEQASVSGVLKANGTTVELPYVYVWALDKGFYNDADPTWKILFVQHPIEVQKLGKFVTDAAYVEVGITWTAEFSEQPRLEVYSQDIKLSADTPGNISGGTYPTIALDVSGPETFSGRLYLPQPMKFFDDTIQYDFTFSAPVSDPHSPIGDALPPGGGEPGKAYLAWVAAVHSGDLAQVKKLVPPDMVGPLEDDDAKDTLEMIAAMTPTSVKILGGSSDGQTAMLEVEGMVDGEKTHGTVTMQKMGDLWMSTGSSW